MLEMLPTTQTFADADPGKYPLICLVAFSQPQGLGKGLMP
ncbi:hypothetical protein H4W33_001243 [Kibdelosporangium phytohabitans]|nr:hypothetical protein [Kibdelosporangium phytohabitans]